jgi:hypothetical protein
MDDFPAPRGELDQENREMPEVVRTYLSEMSDDTIIYRPGIRPAIEVGQAFAIRSKRL